MLGHKLKTLAAAMFLMGVGASAHAAPPDKFIHAFSTFINEKDDYTVNDAITDAEGNIYVQGSGSFSPGDFPAVTTFGPGIGSSYYIAKLNKTGTQVLWITTFRDNGQTVNFSGGGIKIGEDGNIYFGLTTYGGSRLPVVGGKAHTPGDEGYFGKLSPNGSELLYSSYFSGGIMTIALDFGTLRMYLGGNTQNPNLTNKINTYSGTTDGFVALVEFDSTPTIFSRYIGGSGFNEQVNALVVDGGHNAVFAGPVESNGLETTAGAISSNRIGARDWYIGKIDHTGALKLATYLGSTSDEQLSVQLVYKSGSIYFAGTTGGGTGLPTLNARHATPRWIDGYIAKFDYNLQLQWATFAGGSLDEFLEGMKVDPQGNVFVTGRTRSTNFDITTNNLKNTVSDGGDLTFQVYNSSGGLIYSTLFGGNNFDNPAELAVRSDGSAIIVGRTTSTNYPTTPGVIEPTFNEASASFITRLAPAPRVEFSANSYEVQESCNTAYITVVRSGNVDREACFNIATGTGSATPNVDFNSVPSSYQVCWEAGETQNKIVPITIIDDTLDEGNEYFNVEFYAWTNIEHYGQWRVPVTIRDHDAPPVAVAMTSPLNGTTLPGGYIPIYVSTSSLNPSHSVEFRVDNVLVETKPGELAYSFEWYSIGRVDGSHKFEVRVYDRGQQVGSAFINATIVNPSLSLLAGENVPTAGVVQVNIEATSINPLERVQLLRDNVVIATVSGNDITYYLWDTRAVADGDHVLKAQRLDAANRIIGSRTRNMKITNVRVNQTDPNRILTIAGTGARGFNGDGISATAAQLALPRKLFKDLNGDIYFADGANHRIRVIGADGIIRTIAGTGVAGFSGDGGLATAAQLNYPHAVAKDVQNNILYIADTNNKKIRKITADGRISTVMDSTRILSLLWNPVDVEVDSVGNLYVADSSERTVFKVDRTNRGSKVAGSGSGTDGGPANRAYIDAPYGVSVDTDGNIYIAEYFGCRIRKVDTAGIITTVAGNGICGFNGDGGPATSAQVAYPLDVTKSPDGSIYIADNSNNRVRVFQEGGTINTVAGYGVQGFNGDGPATGSTVHSPHGVFADGRNLYISDSVNNRIRGVDFTPRQAQIVGTEYTVDEDTPSFVTARLRRTGNPWGSLSAYLRTGPTPSPSPLPQPMPTPAIAGTDYTPVFTQVRWEGNDLSDKFVNVSITNDDVQEALEGFGLYLSSPSVGGQIIGTPARVLIRDDDNRIIRFVQSSYIVNEDTPTYVAVQLRRIGNPRGTVQVWARTDNATLPGFNLAAADLDYGVTHNLITWIDGDMSDKTMLIRIEDDNLIENPEAFAVLLSSPTNATVAGSNRIHVEIRDNDWGIQFVPNTYKATEGPDSSVAVSLRRVGYKQGIVSAIVGTLPMPTPTPGMPQPNPTPAIPTLDFTPMGTEVRWADQDVADKIINIKILNDNIIEAIERFFVTIARVTMGGQIVGTNPIPVDILDDDNRSIQFSQPTYTVSESSPSAVVTLRRTGNPQGAVSVNLITGSQDATPFNDIVAHISTTINWADQDMSEKIISIPLQNDTVSEPRESLTVTLSNMKGGGRIVGPNPATVYIYDNDFPIDLKNTRTNVNNGNWVVTINKREVTGNYEMNNGTLKITNGQIVIEQTVEPWPWGSGTRESSRLELTLRANGVVPQFGQLYRVNVEGKRYLNGESSNVAAFEAYVNFSGDRLENLAFQIQHNAQLGIQYIFESTHGLPANQPPVVDAGIDQTVTLPTSASLNGSATDDGLPLGIINYDWVKVSGPGNVHFSQLQRRQTDVSFSAAGTYILQLQAHDGVLTSADNLTVTVLPAALGGGVHVNRIDVIAGQTNNPAQASVRILNHKFNPTRGQKGVLEFDVPKPADVTIEIYDRNGQKIKDLLSTTLPAGTHTAEWDGRDQGGAYATSGVYPGVVTINGERHSFKLIVVK